MSASPSASGELDVDGPGEPAQPGVGLVDRERAQRDGLAADADREDLREGLGLGPLLGHQLAAAPTRRMVQAGAVSSSGSKRPSIIMRTTVGSAVSAAVNSASLTLMPERDDERDVLAVDPGHPQLPLVVRVGAEATDRGWADDDVVGHRAVGRRGGAGHDEREATWR